MAVNRETLRLLRSMRVAVDKTVDAATNDLVKAWVYAWDNLSRDWEAALTDLIAQSQDGAWPSRSTIYRAERVLKALDATQDALERLAREAGVRIVEDLSGITTEAAEWQARLTASQMPAQAGPQATLTASFNRVDPGALEAIVNRTTQQVTSTLLPLSMEATASMNAALLRGVALGENPKTAARAMLKRIESTFNGGLTRAMNVARTEMLDAHRGAAYAQDQANADVLAGWEWSAKLDRRTCPSCLAQHGRQHPIDEPGPYDHQQGRCARVPITKTWAELGFKGITEPKSLTQDARAWFDGLPEKDQLQIMGPARLDLLKSGDIGWDDLSQRRTATGWRDSYTVTPVSALAPA